MMTKEGTFKGSRFSLEQAGFSLLSQQLGPLSRVDGFLLAVASGNVYAVVLNTQENDVRVSWRLLGPVGSIYVGEEEMKVPSTGEEYADTPT